MILRFGALLVASFGATALGCSASDVPVDLGHDDRDPGSELHAYVGTWEGYVEGREFPSGSDRVRLTFADDGVGALELGAVVLEPPQPKVGYPPRPAAEDPDMFDNQQLYEGVAYPLHNTRAQTRRLRANLDQRDAYAAWCSLQTPMLRPNSDPNASDYVCVGIEVSQVWDDCRELPSMQPVDCRWAMTCDQVCGCSASGCVAVDLQAILTEVDLTLSPDGRELEGSASQLFNGEGATLRLLLK